VDLIVHTARLKDGSRKIVSITEVYGIEDDDILTQDIFVFDQTGVKDGKIEGRLKPTGVRPTFMAQFARNGVALPPDEFGIPPEDPEKRDRPRKTRWGAAAEGEQLDPAMIALAKGRAVAAGGMVYVSTVGPVDPKTDSVVRGGIAEHARQCMENLSATLQAAGSSLDRIVWANWALRDPAEFEAFSQEWTRWFPLEAPIGQNTLMPAAQRRSGFRVSIGVIAQAGAGSTAEPVIPELPSPAPAPAPAQ
jgi:enamine deaminase RidA (YjgF/YER057c/UK114 family)